MEKQVVAAILLLIAGLLGVGHLLSGEQHIAFRSTQDDLIQEEFESFQWKHDKVYNDANEENMRFNIFKENYLKVQQHNSEKHSFKVAINQFSDLTQEEFKQYLGMKVPETTEETTFEADENLTIPQKVDWRFSSPNLVGPVYNQGKCGSCWAFSTTQAVEGLYAKTKGKFVQLSAQEVLDCANLLYLEFGCNGGNYERAFDMVKIQGICEKDKYTRQYQAKPEHCDESKCPAKFKIGGHHSVKKGSKDSLLAAVAQQPVSVSIEADQWVFQHYSHGIISADSGCGTKLDHAVLAMAYDLNEGSITIKNSWGPDWGEKGFVRFAIKDGDGVCGVNLDPCYPHA